MAKAASKKPEAKPQKVGIALAIDSLRSPGHSPKSQPLCRSQRSLSLHITATAFWPHLLNMENALLDLIDVLIVFAMGFGITMMALPSTYGGVGRRKQSE